MAGYITRGQEKSVVLSASQVDTLVRGGSGDAAYQSHNHDIDNAYTDSVIYTDTLKPGMYVAIMPMLINDRIQQYIILDEIVRIDGHG